MNTSINGKIVSLWIIIILVLSCFLIMVNFGFENSLVRSENLVVHKSGGQYYTKIQDAINAAKDGDNIIVHDGTYSENIVVNKNLTLMGNGMATTTIKGNGTGDVVRITCDGVKMSGFTVTNSGQNLFDAGIEIYYSKNCKIEQCNSSNNYYGIFIHVSDYNNIENNICKNNTYYGISLNTAQSNFISNNICWGLSKSVNDGIHVGDYGSNTIVNNICSYNFNGINIINSNSNFVSNNNCNQNENGICLAGPSNRVENNTFSKNFHGILLSHILNTISNNVCNFNEAHGIYIKETSNNQITDNSLNFNELAGVYFIDSSSNNLLNNTCSKNNLGFELWISSNNNFVGNIVSYNSDKGFFINNYCNDNRIYRNNIILNSVQVLDNGNNSWHGYSYRGNYWSNYYGLDNGANGSKADDGIGDTEIPHADHDYYPLMYIVGWAPDGPPEFNQRDHLDTNGKYTLNWKAISKSKGYILEEDLNYSFPEPIVIYDGNELSYKIENRTNGVYYYRIKAYQDFMETKWSNIINITVDFAPSTPTGLVAENLPGNIVLLSWNQNLENDVIGYYVYQNNNAADINGSYHLIATLVELNTSLLLNDLAENTTYHFKIIAFDVHYSCSAFSNVTSITTLGKVAPIINNSPEDIVMIEDSIDNSSINMHDWFMDFNYDLLTFSCFHSNHMTVKIDQETGNVILKPSENWTGEEVLIFYAYDGMFEAHDDLKITVTPVDDPPGAAQIKSPTNGARIEFGTLVNFTGSCEDPDVEFGDKLVFKWSSDISGDLGKTATLNNILLELGEHEIRLDVWDSANQTSRTSIKITVFETNETDSDRDGIPNFWERRYGLNPTYNGDSTGDWDADTFSNLDEYLADTNPKDPNSYPVKKRADEDNENILVWLFVIVIVVVIVIISLKFIRKKKQPPVNYKISPPLTHPKKPLPRPGDNGIEPQQSPKSIDIDWDD